MKALLVEQAEIRRVTLPDGEDEQYDTMRNLIHCEILERAGWLDENHVAYVDEEAMLKRDPRIMLYAVAWYSYPIGGNIVVVGINDGGFTDVQMTPDTLKEQILIACTKRGDIVATRADKD